MISIKQRIRNRKIVEELKEVYDHHCQICKENEYFSIQMMNGSEYCEVHHIVPLSIEYSIENGTDDIAEGIPEDECLDVLSNMIVLCPNHHKYLHYHKSGGFKIVKNIVPVYK